MPPLTPFRLERFFARYEFSVPYQLSASDCESLTLAELLSLADPESRSLWDNLSLGYTESPGHTSLRGEIASLYSTLDPDKVLVLAPEEGIFIAMHTLLEPGDEVVAISPAYQSLSEIARSIGCRVTPWVLQPVPDGWQIDLEILEKLLARRPRLLVINFPHNPTGYQVSRSDLETILALAARQGTLVFSDEMYRFLEKTSDSRLPAVCDQYEGGISLGGMSKSLALPGLRIGWLATRLPGFLERCLALKDYTTICSSAPSEILALMGLKARAAILDRNLAILRANMEIAGDFFGRHPDRFTWLSPQAGSVAFPVWKGPGTVEAFCERAIEKEGVMIVPGSLFEYAGNHFRVGLGRRNFPEALWRVENLND